MQSHVIWRGDGRDFGFVLLNLSLITFVRSEVLLSLRNSLVEITGYYMQGHKDVRE